MTPALPEDFELTELLQTDIQIESEIKPRWSSLLTNTKRIFGTKHNSITSNMQPDLFSIAVSTLATMGINTAMFQSGIVSRAKLTTTVPTNIVARLNIHKGYFKIEALPVSLPENIAAMQWVCHMTKDAILKAFKQTTVSSTTALRP